MEVRTSLRKALGVAISAATLLALMPLGASMANAATVSDGTDLQLSTADKATLTVKAEKNSYIKGHKFAALRIGTYDYAAKTTATTGDDAHKLTGLSVGTVKDDTIKQAVTDAYTSLKDGAGQNYKLEAAYTDNPVGQVAASLLGFKTTDSLTNNKDESSSKAPYTGQLRDLVTALQKNSAIDAKFAAAPTATAAENETATTATFEGLPQGLYLIKDIADASQIPAGSQLSIPMMVGTGVYEAGSDDNPYVKFVADESGTQLGTVNVKDDELTFTKTLDPNSTSLGKNDWGKFHLTTKVPLTTGFAHYEFKMVDTPSKGFTLPNPLDDQTHGVKVYVKAKASDANTDANKISADLYTLGTQTNSSNGLKELVIDFSNTLANHTDTFKYGYTIDVAYDMMMNGLESQPSNGASLSHSTDPKCDPSVPNTTCPVDVINVPVVKVHTFAIKLKNVLRSNDAALTGSQFTITKDGATDPIEFVKHSPTDPNNGVYTTTDPTGTAQKTSTLDVSSLADDTKGTITLNDMPTGTYVIQQTHAATSPTLRGVMLPKFKITVTKGDGSLTDENVTSSVSVIQDAWGLVNSTAPAGLVTVTNVPSVVQLPLTGGAGIILAVIVILAIAALFGGTVVLKRRHEATRRRV
ncbi:LPXTG cell wall anchor domain-containing protein [Bifidobacterium sp. ESL0732]|uniref:LPXTG cell wall anchor domain-containing protein n=1 Tax=Bifidobacterium sp. ESL0732 TaxID=2983222 RepID=UPI0023F7DF5C|nr:LPXTG cell wall anchor domain-containing protein [Bifidobacterium sp. ESL0732]WEV63986.1 LPXTG cell wall anchor domain-containing protein [Bifidobacterium sp. ESL0732]